MASRRRQLDLQADRIEEVLSRHRVPGRVQGGIVTPKFVRFQVVTDLGTKINKVTSLADEIALALNKREARVYRDGGSISVEIPRSHSEPVRLLPLCDRISVVPALTAVLGLDQNGTPLLLRLPAPDVAHVLIAGTTGSGKTALARTLLASLAMHNRQSLVQMILIDPKGRGFRPLANLPHVLGAVLDRPEAIQERLRWLVTEMERRDREQEEQAGDRGGRRRTGGSAANRRRRGGSHVDPPCPTWPRSRAASGGLYAETDSCTDRRRNEGQFSDSPGRIGRESGRGALCKWCHRQRRRKTGGKGRFPAGRQRRGRPFPGRVDRRRRYGPGGGGAASGTSRAPTLGSQGSYRASVARCGGGGEDSARLVGSDHALFFPGPLMCRVSINPGMDHIQ